MDFKPGVPDRLMPRVRRVIANNPGPFTFTGTGTYIVGEGDVAVIDPGPEDGAHMEALLAALRGERVTHILITHTHHDHSGMAGAFARRVGAPILGFGPHPAGGSPLAGPALDESGDHRYAPDEIIKDGAVIEGENWRIEAVHTPGHLANHLCFALPEKGALFTGDHMMGWSTTVVAPPEGDMADYMASLDLLLARDDDIYFPTHGAPIEKPRRFVRAVKAHRLMRDAQILEQIKKGRMRIKDMVPEMYADIDPRLHPAAAFNVLAHLIRLARMGAVECDGAPGLGSAYRIAG
jgi:glyoxylase-like metal-dependent hydrolase (beta-lactamase superfamily II)